MSYKPRILTPEQLDAKRARDRATKARKAAKNAMERAAAVAMGFGDEVINEIPPAVFARGAILTQMMRTPPCLWPAEWTEDL
jgi:hypothetical protein